MSESIVSNSKKYLFIFFTFLLCSSVFAKEELIASKKYDFISKLGFSSIPAPVHCIIQSKPEYIFLEYIEVSLGSSTKVGSFSIQAIAPNSDLVFSYLKIIGQDGHFSNVLLNYSEEISINENALFLRFNLGGSFQIDIKDFQFSPFKNDFNSFPQDVATFLAKQFKIANGNIDPSQREMKLQEVLKIENEKIEAQNPEYKILKLAKHIQDRKGRLFKFKDISIEKALSALFQSLGAEFELKGLPTRKVAIDYESEYTGIIIDRILQENDLECLLKDKKTIVLPRK